MRHPSWEKIVDAFDGAVDKIPLAQRVTQLEQTVAQQRQYIAVLEEKLNNYRGAG